MTGTQHHRPEHNRPEPSKKGRTEAMKKYYLDKYGNAATITRSKGYSYQGATRKTTEYTLVCFALYDNDKIYYVSIFDSMEAASEKLSELSNGTFEELKTA